MLTIEKRDYSSRPWRLVKDGRQEIEVPIEFEHPGLGKTTIVQSIGGNTKAEALKETLAFLERLMDQARKRVES